MGGREGACAYKWQVQGIGLLLTSTCPMSLTCCLPAAFSQEIECKDARSDPVPCSREDKAAPLYLVCVCVLVCACACVCVCMCVCVCVQLPGIKYGGGADFWRKIRPTGAPAKAEVQERP